MSLKSSQKVDVNRYQLEVEVAADVFEKAVDRAFRKESKKITIPGFRKGKAPRAFIEKYYGKDVFYEDAINQVYPSALGDAVEEAGLEFVEDKIDFDLVEAGENGLTFKATITTKPEVSIENYKGLEVKKQNTAVTDEDVEAEVNRARERNARMVTVEDRPAEKDDITVIDFEGFLNGEPFEGGKGENYSLTLGSNQFIPGFEDQIIGHSTNDEFDVNVTFPEEYHAENLKGKSAVFHVKLHEIKKKELPAADDDFAKDVSSFDTLDEYKADIRRHLEESREKAAKDDIDNQIIDQLNGLLEAEIPEAMFQNRINEDVREFGYRLQSQGLDYDTYLKYTGMDSEKLRESFRPQAERQVKIRLALEKIAKLENIEATQEEIDEEYKKIADAYKMEAEQVKGFIPQAELAKDIAVEKAMGIVRDSAKVTAAE